jgi:hypothetical protein
LDHSYVYIFVRQDISVAQQIVQSNHATYSIAQQQADFDRDCVPSIVVIGVPNLRGLERVIKKLHDNGIEHAQFVEPDFDMGLSAVATAPLWFQEQRDVLKNYCTWKDPRCDEKKSYEGGLYD